MWYIDRFLRSILTLWNLSYFLNCTKWHKCWKLTQRISAFNSSDFTASFFFTLALFLFNTCLMAYSLIIINFSKTSINYRALKFLQYLNIYSKLIEKNDFINDYLFVWKVYCDVAISEKYFQSCRIY